jgi:hypothetical protein
MTSQTPPSRSTSAQGAPAAACAACASTWEGCSGGSISWPALSIHTVTVDPARMPPATVMVPVWTAPPGATHRAGTVATSDAGSAPNTGGGAAFSVTALT